MSIHVLKPHKVPVLRQGIGAGLKQETQVNALFQGQICWTGRQITSRTAVAIACLIGSDKVQME